MAKKPKQGYLSDDLAPPSIKAIDNAADAYVEARDARMNMLTEEIKLKEKLHALMKEHDLTTYEYDNYTVEVAAVEGIKVKKKKAAVESSDGDE